MTAKTILLPIFLKLVRLALMTVGAWFVRKGWLEAQDQDSITAYGVDLAPGLLAMLPGIAWDLWAWLSKFSFIAKIETALHLPVTGQPNNVTIAVAATNTASAGK